MSVTAVTADTFRTLNPPAPLPSSSTWGQQSSTTACQSQATLSLAEIQKLEEERERQLREEHSNLHTSIGNSVWGSINTGPPNQWASDLVTNIWSNADTKNSNMGFWDDAVKEDSVWGMNHSALHSVFQTNQSNNQQSNFEAVQSGKKKKKQKMVRADPSLLGFSVNASSERLNMGEIETLDDY
ncbi:PERQ amino acid-rich with GYF domain-containing protein 2 [Pteropus alecto]|uniref:PERQ amino acid-rich with GYF domain-containing protein 2 n=1 Tax=Pteropus alecto TaxID=9402 RepID=L5L0Z4_PTEAL|nr:PERQ amino acid-rich with GYF domain-containing protein 2 [Pteropus alecto]